VILRLLLRLALVGLSLSAFFTFSIVAVSRTLGGGAVLQYGLAAPDDRVMYIGVDVARNLSLMRNQPLPAHLFSATDTAADGRQVFSAPSIGNIDLYLAQTDGTRRQLTRFTDFPAIGGERADRRANVNPSWSPDNTWIAFVSATISGRNDLYIVRPDGSGLRYLGNRIRLSEPHVPRWVTFHGEPPLGWLLGCFMSLIVFIINGWSLKGYNGSSLCYTAWID
jgi:hypothetical protein